MTAAAKGRTPRPRPVAAESNGFPVLRLKTAANGRGPRKRVPLFYIDDDEYTMLAEPTASEALRYLDVIQRQGVDAGFTFAMDLMIGAEAYQKLITYPKLTRAEFAQVAKVVTDHLLGALQEEDPKGTL